MRVCHKCDQPATNATGIPVCDDCRQQYRDLIPQICKECGESFNLPSRRARCHRCHYAATGKPKRCKGCGVSIDGRAKSGLCRTCWGANHTGPASPNWEGGRTFHKPSGYWLVKAPDHPNARADGYVREHILVVTETIGRPLYSHEVVHHINHNKTDNRPENLAVMSRVAHQLLHGGKLTWEDVQEIRRVAAENNYPPGRQGSPGWAKKLMDRFGVTRNQIYRIARGEVRVSE